MLAPVTPELWSLGLLLGFRSNGCSSSPDALVLGGAPIANGDESYPPLPCDLHDFRYFCGGTRVDRGLADAELYAGVLEVALRADEPMRSVWEEQALLYLKTVRILGGAWWDERARPLLPRFFG